MPPTYKVLLDTEGNAEMRWSHPKNVQCRAVLSNDEIFSICTIHANIYMDIFNTGNVAPVMKKLNFSFYLI